MVLPEGFVFVPLFMLGEVPIPVPVLLDPVIPLVPAEPDPLMPVVPEPVEPEPIELEPVEPELPVPALPPAAPPAAPPPAPPAPPPPPPPPPAANAIVELNARAEANTIVVSFMLASLVLSFVTPG